MKLLLSRPIGKQDVFDYDKLLSGKEIMGYDRNLQHHTHLEFLQFLRNTSKNVSELETGGTNYGAFLTLL